MFIEFTTTITHRIELDDEGIAGITHATEVDPGDAIALGDRGVHMIVKAGCEATIKAIEAQE